MRDLEIGPDSKTPPVLGLDTMGLRSRSHLKGREAFDGREERADPIGTQGLVPRVGMVTCHESKAPPTRWLFHQWLLQGHHLSCWEPMENYRNGPHLFTASCSHTLRPCDFVVSFTKEVSPISPPFYFCLAMWLALANVTSVSIMFAKAQRVWLYSAITLRRTCLG